MTPTQMAQEKVECARQLLVWLPELPEGQRFDALISVQDLLAEASGLLDLAVAT